MNKLIAEYLSGVFDRYAVSYVEEMKTTPTDLSDVSKSFLAFKRLSLNLEINSFDYELICEDLKADYFLGYINTAQFIELMQYTRSLYDRAI